MPECGHSYTEMRWEAANTVDRRLPFRVLHISEYLAECIKDGSLKVNRVSQSCTFHDPCQVSRLGGAAAAPRVVLSALGVDLHEMPGGGDMNWCCGGVVVVALINRAQALRDKVFQIKKEQIDATGTDTVYVSCSGCRQTLEHGDEVQEFYLTWTRRRETSVEQLQDKATNQLAELGRKGETINRFKIEHEAQKAEVAALKTELNGLEERLNALKERLVSLAPRPKAEEARSGKPARDLNPGRHSSGQHIGAARDGSDFSPGSPVAEPSIHACPRASGYQFVSNKPWIGRRTPRSVARFFIVALIGVGATFAWQFHGDGAKEVVRTSVSSLGSLLSVSTTKSTLDVDVAAKQTGSTPAGKMFSSAQDAALPQPAPVPQRAPAAAATSPDHSVEQLAAKQEQMSDNIATLHTVEPDIKQNASSPPLQNGTQLTPTLETRPTTIEGWTLREVTNGTAVLEGPDGGIWGVKSGDTVPGLGKIGSYNRSNGRWAVATTRGLILMQVRQNASFPPLQNGTQLTPTPETRPKTIEGWTLREVTNGAAILEGPDGGISSVKSGDTVPGLGKIESYVRSNGRWAVATTRGLILMQVRQNASSSHVR
jgi:hypothetical protein